MFTRQEQQARDIAFTIWLDHNDQNARKQPRTICFKLLTGLIIG